jgi:hypothetical protein
LDRRDGCIGQVFVARVKGVGEIFRGICIAVEAIVGLARWTGNWGGDIPLLTGLHGVGFGFENDLFTAGAAVEGSGDVAFAGEDVDAVWGRWRVI